LPRLRPTRDEVKQTRAWASAFIRHHGGGSTHTVRFECLPGVGVPEVLRGVGYKPRLVGTVERLLPGEGDQMIPTVVEVFEVELPTC
jgi:hypothetical protein